MSGGLHAEYLLASLRISEVLMVAYQMLLVPEGWGVSGFLSCNLSEAALWIKWADTMQNLHKSKGNYSAKSDTYHGSCFMRL